MTEAQQLAETESNWDALEVRARREWLVAATQEEILAECSFRQLPAHVRELLILEKVG